MQLASGGQTSLETMTQFRGSAITLSAAAFSPKDAISLPLRRDVNRARRGRETAEVHDRLQHEEARLGAAPGDEVAAAGDDGAGEGDACPFGTRA
jgi:hypothetical protein